MEITVREKAEPFAPVIALLLLLVGAAVFGLYLGWALMAGAILFTLDAKRHGRTWGQVGNMLAQGLKKAWIVVQVLLVIGLLTASWISCGAIPCLVRLGALVIRPHVFLLCTFWLCAVMSFLLGTSFGTANTMGVVMMTLARAGGVSLPMTAGAILCGIYVGDRCSPMSSSLLLLSTLTETELYDNVGMTMKSMLVPFVAASGGYLFCSFLSPLVHRLHRPGRTVRGGVQPESGGTAPHRGGLCPLFDAQAGKAGHGGEHGLGLSAGGVLPGDAGVGAGQNPGLWLPPAGRPPPSPPSSTAAVCPAWSPASSSSPPAAPLRAS